MKKRTKWTTPLMQQESNRIHDNKFIIHSLELKEYGKHRRRQTYINLECKTCGFKNSVIINSHIKGVNCKGCFMWNINKLQKASDKVHNFNFIIHSIETREYGNLGNKQAYCDAECKICNHRNWINVDAHINKLIGCGGVCWQHVERKVQIETLQLYPELAKKPYNLYLLKFTNQNEEFLKVGKTCKTITNRFNGKDYSDYEIEILQVIESTHLEVALTEDKILNEYYERYKHIPKIKFGGHTECFRMELLNEFGGR